MIICPKCGSSYSDDSRFCKKCGTDMAAKDKFFCPQCNSEMDDPNVKFCKICGTKLGEEMRPVLKHIDNFAKICPECGNSLPNNGARFCKSCGVELTEDKKPLLLLDNVKYYRVCLQCGSAYELNSGMEFCRNCGGKIASKPRTSPELSEEEKAAVLEWQENERLRQEEEARRAKERMEWEEAERIRLENEKKAKRRRARKKILGGIVVIALLAAVSAGAGIGAWILVDRNNIKKAEAALSASNYEEAIGLYTKISDKSRYYSGAQERIEVINQAVAAYDSAKTSFDKADYIKAMAECKRARDMGTGMPVIDELYTKAQTEYGLAAKKYIEGEKYKEARDMLEKIDAADKNDEMKNCEKQINEKIKEYYDNGNKLLKSGDLDGALNALKAARYINADSKDDTNLKEALAEAFAAQAEEKYAANDFDGTVACAKKAKESDSSYSGSKTIIKKVTDTYVANANSKYGEKKMSEVIEIANKALELEPNNTEVKTLKTNAGKYNDYIDKLNKAMDAYNSGDIYTAYDYLSQVPTDDIGAMARENVPSLVQNVTNDHNYIDDPVALSNTSSSGTKYSADAGFVDLDLTLENKLSRTVEVTVRYEISTSINDYYDYKTYTLSPYQTLTDRINVDRVYFGYHLSNYNWNIEINDYDIK